MNIRYGARALAVNLSKVCSVELDGATMAIEFDAGKKVYEFPDAKEAKDAVDEVAKWLHDWFDRPEQPTLHQHCCRCHGPRKLREGGLGPTRA